VIMRFISFLTPSPSGCGARSRIFTITRWRSPVIPLFDYPPYDLALATRMAEVAQLYDLDLLHVHYAIPHSVSAMLARQMLADGPRGKRLPFVTTLHGTDITLVGLDRSYLPITRYSIEQSDGVTAISNYLRDRTQRVFDVKKSIEVIYNSVNCDVYSRNQAMAEEIRREYAPNNQRVLVHLSNFRPVKRITDVIEIFDRVHKQMPSRLLLIGGRSGSFRGGVAGGAKRHSR
jgi:hypothetical protein